MKTKNKFKKMSKMFVGFLVLIPAFSLLASEPDKKALENKGVGPIKEVKLEAIELALASSGKTLFTSKCSACHKMTERYVGPALKDLTKRRSPEWIMNMVMNPAEMTQKDSVAQELLGEYLTQMTFQNVTEAETRSILEYFRYFDEKGDIVSPEAKKASVSEGESEKAAVKSKGKKKKK